MLFNPIPVIPKLPAKVDVPYAWLKGGNIGGMTQSVYTTPSQLPFVNGTNGKIPVAGDRDYYLSKGWNCIRYLVSQEMLQSDMTTGAPIRYGKLNANMAAIKTSVELFTNAGIYVIFGIHSGDTQGFNKFDGNKFVPGGNTSAAMLADYFVQLCDVFRGNNLVAWGLLNEPQSGNRAYPELISQVIKAIRYQGQSGAACFVNGISFSGAQYFSTTNYFDDDSPVRPNSQLLLDVVDPLDNLVFETHNYFSTNSGNANDVISPTVGRDHYANVVSWANTNNKRIIVGEWGQRAGITNANANAQDFVNYCKANAASVGQGPVLGMLYWAIASPPFFRDYSKTRFGITPGDEDSYAVTWTPDHPNMDLLDAIGAWTDPVPTPAFDPLTDLPNKYAYYNPSTASVTSGLVNSIADSSGLAADATKTLTAKTSGGFVKPTYTASDPNFNNLPSITQPTVGLAALLSGTFTTPVPATATYYLVYYVYDQPPNSTLYLRHRADNSTTLTNTHSLIHYFSFAASTNGTNQVTRGSLTGLANRIWLLAVVHNGANSRIYTNSLTAASTADTGSGTSLSMGVGNATGNNAKWGIGEHFVYSSAHSNSDVGTMMTYLANRYNVILT